MHPVGIFGEGDAEDLLDVLVRPFGLDVGLWVVSARTAALDVEELAELSPDLGPNTGLRSDSKEREHERDHERVRP